MKLTIIDGLIILLYLVFTIVLGLVMKKRAEKDKSSYLLGGNKLPWYMLGLSNASGMFDISGTMWLVTITFVYGLKSIWLPWLWPVFNQIFLMVYLSIWLRRSGATTGAEWMRTRFGTGRGGKLSHYIVVIYALVGCLGFLAYGFIGLGKFVEIFLPWEVVSGILGINLPEKYLIYVPHMYGVVFTLFAMFYAILGGMTSIVWADVVQYAIMTISAVVIGGIAMKALGDQSLNVPEGWMSPFFGKNMDINWQGIIEEVNRKIASDGYSLFSVFFMMMLFKGILVSAAGPAPNFDMQKILSSKSPQDAAKMSGLVSVVLMPARYLMIAGFAVLGLLFYSQLDLIKPGSCLVDFETILPSAINEFVPVGLMGLLLAGLLAAFNSTFAGTLNAAQAYVVNDIYLKAKPKASNRQVKRANYITGIVTVVVSIAFGIFARNVDSVLQWIVSALWGSYVASNVLKWYWWKFNSKGYFWGMATGMVTAMIPGLLGYLFSFQVNATVINAGYDINEYKAHVECVEKSALEDVVVTGMDDINTLNQLVVYIDDMKKQSFVNRISSMQPIYFFPVILVLSLLGCLIPSFFTKPDDREVLKKFYKSVRPWGFWKPIHDEVVKEDPSFKRNKDFPRDMFNIVVGVVAQTALVIFPIYLVLRQGVPLIISVGIAVVCGVILKKTWWDRLKEID